MMIKQWLRQVTETKELHVPYFLHIHSHPDVIIGNLSSSTVQQERKVVERFILVSHRKDLICNDRCVVKNVWGGMTITDFREITDRTH